MTPATGPDGRCRVQRGGRRQDGFRRHDRRPAAGCVREAGRCGETGRGHHHAVPRRGIARESVPAPAWPSCWTTGVSRSSASGLVEHWGADLLPAGRDARRDNHADHLGVTPQRQEGLYSVRLCVPTGRTCADEMTELARLASAYGSGAIRLTVGQNAIIADVPEANLPALLAEPLLSRLSPEARPFARGLVSCTGNDYCNLALIETKSVSQRVAQALDTCYPDAAPLRMYWSGCPAGCGNLHARRHRLPGWQDSVRRRNRGRGDHIRGRQHRPQRSPGEEAGRAGAGVHAGSRAARSHREV